jgi:hypothetical protein
MTSNEVRALDRPRRGGARRGLRFLIAALSLSLAVIAFSAMPVMAAGTTSTTTSSTETGYSQKPEKPKEEKKVAPSKEEKKVAPAKEETTPKAETEPAKEVVTAPATAEKLPFTGLDLRWVVGMGLLLILGGGVSLRVVRRRERHGIGR